MEALTMQNLEDLRKEINNIDDKIIDLLSKRKDLVKDIAQIKKGANKPILDKGREQHILERLKLRSKEKNLDESFIRSIYNIILKSSKEEQEKIVKG